MSGVASLGTNLAIDRSACCTIVTESVAELLAGFGSVTPPGVDTVAVFDSVPTWPTPCR